MAKKTSSDIGYKAYFAAFAVMLVIIIAAICILSGCLDGIIFNATPSIGDDAHTGEVLPPSDTDPTDPLPGESSDVADDTNEPAETGDKAPSEDTETEPEDTTKAPETTEKPEETTKKPEDTTTSKKEESSETTKAPADTELLENEIISEQDNNLLYQYKNKALTITGYVGSASEVAISQKIDGIKVQTIGDGAFDGNAVIEKIRISAGVKKIGSKAFANCTELTYVYIPTTVTEIASDAFKDSGNVVIYCEAGSYAEHFASDNAISCVTN